MVVNSPNETATVLQSDIDKISRWADQWLVHFNPSKSESMLISRKTNKPPHPPLSIGGVDIPLVNIHKHLGVYLANDCTWHEHITFIKEKAWKRINIMRRLKSMLDRKSLETIYFAFIRPILEYSNVILTTVPNMKKKN